jgi:hypothetical protein
MAIPEIIDEIDAYLSRLRLAREVLLDRSTEAPQTRVSRRKRKAPVKQADEALFHKSRPDQSKPQLDLSLADVKKETKRVDTSVLVTSAPTHRASDSEHPAIAQQEPTIAQSVVIKRLPSKGPRHSRSIRHRTPKTAVPKADATKPAIALAGPVSRRIVVVPVEQVRRERELAELPEVQRPRTRASGLTGRQAFEALFK